MKLDEVYDVVMQTAYIACEYERASEKQKATFRIFQVYQEMASGGFEGYMEWVLSSMDPKAALEYSQKAIESLRQIGAVEMATIMLQHTPVLQEALHNLQANRIDEDAYVDFLTAANEAYYKVETIFSQQIHGYIDEIYRSIENHSYFERSN